MTDGNGYGISTMQAVHRKRLEVIRDEAIAIAGNAARISQAVQQVLERGGMSHIQPQLAFLTGALNRMTKDWGVVEYLQAQGVTQKKPTPTK